MGYKKLAFCLSIVYCLILVGLVIVLFVMYGNVHAHLSAESGVEIGKLHQIISNLNETMAILETKMKELESQNSKTEMAPTYEVKQTNRTGTFDEARQMCIEMGGRLVQRTLTKNLGGKNYTDELESLIQGIEPVRGNLRCWVGITDRLLEGTWTYLNDEKFPDSTSDLIFDWWPGQPDDSLGEDCADLSMLAGRKIAFNDVPCSWEIYGCCEI